MTGYLLLNYLFSQGFLPKVKKVVSKGFFLRKVCAEKEEEVKQCKMQSAKSKIERFSGEWFFYSPFLLFITII